MKVDIMLINGDIYTSDPQNPRCTALAISGNRILAAGSDSAILSLADAGGQTIDLNGSCVIPGLVDAHLHFEGYALSLQRIDLADIPDLDQTLSVVQNAAAGDAMSEWIEGRGWTQALWPDGQFPTANDLDRIVPNRPVMLRHRSGHAAWVNTKAMRIAKLDEVTADPKGGAIQRDASGKPTGILFEKAMNIVSDCVPKPSVGEVADAMVKAQETCHQFGLTGIHDFDGRRCFLALQELRGRDALGLRVVKSIPNKRLDHALGIGLTSGFGDDWIRIGSLKLFADGALGPRTASMIAPYEGEDDNYGLIVTDKEEMVILARKASRQGLSVAVHAIGDKANHDVLDVFEAVAQESGGMSPSEQSRFPRVPNRIEHAQLLHEVDLTRFAQIGVVASMQPIHMTADMEMAERHWGNRCELAYAWRSLIDSGATLAFGSGAPVESINPLDGIHAAVTRARKGDGNAGDGWFPAQKITIEEAVAGYTYGPAYVSGRSDRMGRVREGYLADLTILKRNIFEMLPDEIPSAGIAGTIVDGEVKYQDW